MGIYINAKDMEMPKQCSECPFETSYWFCWFFENRGETGYFTADEGRRKDCPLVEIPSHGDLIDRKELMQTVGITDKDCEKCGWYDGRCLRSSDFVDACVAIEEAKTIIAEEK